MKLKKHQPDYDIDDFLSPTHGDFKDKIGRVTEINIGPWGIHYGLVDLPCSWGKVLYYKQDEVRPAKL